MSDEITRTPVPVPTYGQPAAAPTPTITAPAGEVAPTTESTTKEITMADAGAASPNPAMPSTNAPSPAPVRTSTPSRTSGQDNTSRAASQHPDPAFTMPESARAHGAPVRQYLNTKVTGHLVEGVKILAREQPKDPLRVLGEWLIERSKEVENN